MAKVDLKIRFDRDDRCYHIGEKVLGHLAVQVNDDGRCNGFILACEWSTHGKGNKTTGDRMELKSPGRDLQRGESFTIPFEFVIPSGPLSYHGTYLNVDWYIRAVADIPWAIDPKAEEDFLVIQPPGDDRMLLPGDPAMLPHFASLRGRPAATIDAAARATLEAAVLSEKSSDLSNMGAGCVLSLGATIFLFGMFFVWLFASDVGIFLMIPCSIVPISIATAVIFLGLRNSIAERKLGKVELALTPSRVVGPGTTLQLALSFRPTAALRLNKVVVSLKGVEEVISGSGSNRTTHTHVLHEESIEIGANLDLVPGRPVALAAPLLIPENGPATFLAASAAVKWTVDLRIDIPLWPDYVKTQPILVVPASVNAGLYGLAANVPLGPPELRPGSAKAAPTPAAMPQSPATAPAPRPGSPLALAIKRLQEASFSSDRDKVFEDFKGHSFSIELTITELLETSGIDAPEALRRGRTLIGQATGLEGLMEIQLPPALNEEAAARQRGDVLALDVELSGWNRLQQRPILVTAPAAPR